MPVTFGFGFDERDSFAGLVGYANSRSFHRAEFPIAIFQLSSAVCMVSFTEMYRVLRYNRLCSLVVRVPGC
jgi:hypothetical protein